MPDHAMNCFGPHNGCSDCPNRSAFMAELASIAGMSSEEHREHHEFVRELVEDMRSRKRMRQKIMEQAGGWAVISLLGALGTWVWRVAQEWLHKGH